MDPSIPALSIPLDDGPSGVNQTLKLMVKLARAGRKHPDIRHCAAELVRPLASKDWRGEICRIFNFVRDNIRYTPDIRTIETLHPANIILSQGYGDCDDCCILLASLLESVGHPCRFIAMGFSPGSLSHVIVDTKAGRFSRNGAERWVPLDATMKDKDAGWYPPGICSTMGPMYV